MKYSYVSLLYGDNQYFLGAMMLGFSLSKIYSMYDKVLMVTPDVPMKQRVILAKYFIIIEVEYIDINPINFLIQNTRFSRIFTKLRLFELTTYDKVLFLDIDMFVIKNMDHLFNLTAPAGMLNGEYPLKTGDLISADNIKIINGRVKRNINAGTLLIKPNKKEFELMMYELTTVLPYKLKSPEQEYLSYRYRNNWTYLEPKYNCQIGISEYKTANSYTIHDIYNLHYSWILNPWELVLENKKKVWTIIKKQKRDETYYHLWVMHFEILYRLLQKDNIDLLKLFKYDNTNTEKINSFFNKLSRTKISRSLKKSKKKRIN